MNTRILDIIQSKSRRLEHGRIEVVFEAGRAVHVTVTEDLEDPELLDAIVSDQRALKAEKFYGRLKLPIKNGQIYHPKIETSLKA